MKLPWNFEAFRNFITYETLQQASSVLCLFEGQDIFYDPYLMQKFEHLLSLRTGLQWLPARNVNQDILFNTEGDVFRNKARVFTSFYLIHPSCLIESMPLKITRFAKALGSGQISRNEFYNTIIERFQYPHPAYKENWNIWRDAGKTLKPFVYILEILARLHSIGESHANLSVSEFSQFAHSVDDFNNTEVICQHIISNRENPTSTQRVRSDEVDRKVGDIFGFICMTGWTYYKSNVIHLNLIARHPKEKVFFYEKRDNINKKESLLKLINDAKKEN